MTMTVDDRRPPGERAPTPRRDPGGAGARAEIEPLRRQLEEARARVRELEDELLQARRLEAIGRLTRGVAHDFNNVMGVISGYTELMLRRLDGSDPLRRSAEAIGKATDWGLNLVKHLLTASQPGPPIAGDLNAIASTVVRTLQPLLGGHIELVTRFAPRLGRVNIGSGELEQIVMNLVLNARDALGAGGRLSVETANTRFDHGDPPGPQPAVMLRVADTGCGMDRTVLARAFEPYFTTKEAGKGTGLGLANVFGIVTKHSGHVDVTSTVGEGTTVTVYLPSAGEDGSPEEVDLAPGVLVVDDEPGVRDLIVEILEIHHYRVLQASDLDEARRLAASARGPLALAVVDVTLAGGGADRFVDDLRAHHRQLKVLYVSGEIEEATQSLWAGRSDAAFLHKPFTVNAFVGKVREFLGG